MRHTLLRSENFTLAALSSKYGQVARNTVCPEMFEEAA